MERSGGGSKRLINQAAREEVRLKKVLIAV